MVLSRVGVRAIRACVFAHRGLAGSFLALGAVLVFSEGRGVEGAFVADGAQPRYGS